MTPVTAVGWNRVLIVQRICAFDLVSGPRGRLVATLALCAVLLGLAPSLAVASTVSLFPPALAYEAADGETNSLSVSRTASGEYDLVDPGATIAAPPECLAVDLEAHHVRCPGSEVGTVTVWLGDLDDGLTLADSAYPTATDAEDRPITAGGGPGADILTGAAGPDDLFGGSGADVISGGEGEDFIRGGGVGFFPDAGLDGDDELDGGPGDDESISGGAGDDQIDAGSGDDRVVNGEAGNDVIMGSAGDDDLVGGPGDDRINGGDGSDAVDVGVLLVGAPDESLLLGRDRLDGGAGDDRIGAGFAQPLEPDVLGGGSGFDTVSYAARTAFVVVSLDGVADDGESGEADDVRPDVEQLIGGVESDTLMGSDAAEQLVGGPGDDLLFGRGGDDRLDGGAGSDGSDGLDGGPGRDVLQGGPGDDSLAGGADDDVARGGGGSDTVAGDDGRDDVSGGTGLDTVTGGDGDDTVRGGDEILVGADGADDLDGGNGDDTLAGGPGNDRVDGGQGADRISGDAGRDAVSYEGRVVAVTVTFDGLPNDGEPGEHDNVDSTVETVLGGGVGDTLIGDAGRNALNGGEGEDLLVGRGGQDALNGGSAPDVVRARDGAPDVVDCGSGGDLAILDRFDRARRCEFTDRSGSRRPAFARALLARTTRGRAAFRLPRARRYTRLRDQLRLPVGTTIDARAGRVRLTTARNAARTRQSALFSEGAFSVRQTRSHGRRGITEIRLRGGTFSMCRPSAGRATAAASRPVRRLRAKGRARYRMRGRYSIGGALGTTWVTEDRCNGTLTRVIQGTVVVRDFTLRRTVVLHAGNRYLARAPGPSGR
jgi:Ca2+-binding RTX toxin-like protein